MKWHPKYFKPFEKIILGLYEVVVERFFPPDPDQDKHFSENCYDFHPMCMSFFSPLVHDLFSLTLLKTFFFEKTKKKSCTNCEKKIMYIWWISFIYGEFHLHISILWVRHSIVDATIIMKNLLSQNVSIPNGILIFPLL
mgnify:CR=1 FL=1